MCGIAGYLAGAQGVRDNAGEIAGRMADALRHRGPDGRGVWLDAEAGVALAHRRLAILDLSANGAQPMLSASGRYVLSFNGQVYNHRALRRELDQAGKAADWRGHSDTEIMLAAFEAWGLERALGRFNGMFAFALWDRSERMLHLARDRMGEKPLYYGWMGGALLFGSELSALRAHPAWRGDVDRNALTLLMRHNAVPAPYSIYKGVHKLPPASIISFTAGGPYPPCEEATPRRYWDFRAVVNQGLADPWAGSESEAIDSLDALLRDAVKLRMEADVPLGAFLSGGVDSSTVVALMQAQTGRPVRTFSIGFHDAGYNEAHHAAEVARHLGTDHTELYVTPQQALDVIPQLPRIYDEPFADSSQVPTFLVSQLARRHVTVSLSGDGGDELFGGYDRYFLAESVWQKSRRLPRLLRRTSATAIRALSPKVWNRMGAASGPALPSLRAKLLGDRMHKGAALLDAEAAEQLYLQLVTQWPEPEALVVGAREPVTVLSKPEDVAARGDFLARMMALDALWYLPDDILVKIDRASMAVSLEGRIPLLDHRVVEMAWRLPRPFKVRDGQGKWILREVLYRYVPRALIERPKMGFGVPIDRWLRGPLRDWAESLLDESRLRREGYFDPAPIREKWMEHLSGSRNWRYLLWDVLMFQQWLEAQAGA